MFFELLQNYKIGSLPPDSELKPKKLQEAISPQKWNFEKILTLKNDKQPNYFVLCRKYYVER